jgi:hypothetical protein
VTTVTAARPPARMKQRPATKRLTFSRIPMRYLISKQTVTGLIVRASSICMR